MKIIRFDSVGGASGDMILSSLIGLGVDPAVLEEELASLIPGEFHIRTEVVSSHGIGGTRVIVDIPGLREDDHTDCSEEKHLHHHCDGEHRHHHHHHHNSAGHFHRSFADIRKMIEESRLSEAVKRDSVALFQILAEAEGEVHGKSPEDVHFHEVGAVDSIVDIVGAVIGFHQLGIDAVSVSPLPVGSGTVKCAHGICPVPAPATSKLIQRFQLPISLDGEDVEMLTPTGALILGWLPKADPAILQSVQVLRIADAIGGRLLKERPNLLRASLCETGPEQKNVKKEKLLRFDANIDDLSAEISAYAAEKLFQAGALDVWFTPILMKKGRPATQISLLLPETKRNELLEILFRQTGTFGIREEEVTRYPLDREFEQVQTSGGPVSIKIGSFCGEEIHFAPEFKDCVASAENGSKPVIEIYREAAAAYRSRKQEREE